MNSVPFDGVVTRHGPTVLRVCRAVLGPVAAEDAWSETFLAALRAYPQLPENSNVEAWLVTIAHRKAIDAVRAAARRPVPVAEPDLGADPRPTVEPESTLWDAVRALPDKQRLCVAYHYLGGLPYDEIAAIVGGTAAAARRAAADGVATLRRTYPRGDTA